MAAVDRILTRLQHALAAAGARGTTGLEQSFRTMDSRGDGRLSYEEFSQSLKAAGVRLSEQDVRTLFISFDKHGNNHVEIREFVHALAGEVSPRRRALIERVFRNIAGNEDAASLADVGACFRADRHPDVERGVSTPGKVLSDLLEALRESNTLANGRVTRQGLVDFYRLSSAFVSDNDFEAVMEAVWVPRTSRVPRGKQRTLAEATLGGNDGGKQRARALVETLRQNLAVTGVRGIVSLGRRFRANDRDKIGTLSEVDFRRCMREAPVRLEEGELRALFDAFDVNHSGRISYDDFMRALRGELGQQRHGLVERAFDLLDANKSGAVEPRDIVERFDSARHPDVIEGRRSRDEIYREFLDTFDVGGVVDGKVTRSEFEEYYSNVSASVDSDDFFEVMMRSVWHIPRGDGWPHKAAKLRLLVTHADGSQSVEGIADDFGLELPRDRLEIIRRLRACGVDAVDVSLHSPEIKSSAGPEKDSSACKDHPPHLPTTLGAVAAVHSQLSSEDQASSLAGDASNCQGETQRPLSAKTKFLWTAGVESVVERLRTRLSALGRHGYHKLKRAFIEADVDADGLVSLGEFIEAVNNRIGLICSRKDAEAVFKVFDEERTMTIDYVDFMRFVAPPTVPSRIALVRLAFDAMDTEGTGAVPPDVIARRYDAAAHVDVRAGLATAQDTYASFMEHFDIGSERDGLVTLGDFEAYHALLSANEPDDLSFEALVRDLWRIKANLAMTDSALTVNNTGKIRLRVVCANGRIIVEELPEEYGLRDAKGKLCEREAVRRLQLRGVNAAAAEELVDELIPENVNVDNHIRPPAQSQAAKAQNEESAPAVREPSFHKGTERRAVDRGSGDAHTSTNQADEGSGACLPNPERQDERAAAVTPPATTPLCDAAVGGCTQQSPALGGIGSKMVKSAWGPSSVPQTSGDGAAAAGVAALAKGLASQLQCRGQQGFVALRRSLRSVADDAGLVTLASFKSAARATGLDASDAELRALFSYIDSDSCGSAKAEACVNAIRPRMSSRRSVMVDLAFKRIDVNSVGAIAPSVLAMRFDPSRAPEVVAGRQTKQAAYDSFLQSFDVDPDRAHGRVTKHDFFEFHADLSAAIEKDDNFFDFVRNVWRLSPLDIPNNVSASRDSSRHITVVARRVDGRQTVERLPASLRGTINLDDADDLVAALREHCNIAASSAVAVKDDQTVLSHEEGSNAHALGTDATRPGPRSIAHVGAAHVAAAAELVSRRFEDRPRGRKMVGGLASRSTGGQALPGNSTQ